jgi:hypothetical protein
MKNRRIIISISDDITDEKAVSSVLKVIKQGRISKTKGNKQYCFLTITPDDIAIYAREKYKENSADSFVVYKDKYN